MKTAFFGGSFDPVHNGHLAIAHSVLSRGIADRILFVPAPNPPHKDARRLAPFEARLAMLLLASDGAERISVSDLERERFGKSYSIDTLRLLSERFPGDEILLLFGSDSLMTLHQWKSPHAIVREFGVVTYPRKSHPVQIPELRRHWNESEVSRLLSGVIPSSEPFDVSSTFLRNLLLRGLYEEAAKHLPCAVLSYIREHALYLDS